MLKRQPNSIVTLLRLKAIPRIHAIQKHFKISAKKKMEVMNFKIVLCFRMWSTPHCLQTGQFQKLNATIEPGGFFSYAYYS